jgi:hypothetical protein
MKAEIIPRPKAMDFPSSRPLAIEPMVLLLDEPTAPLDATMRSALQNFRQIAQNNPSHRQPAKPIWLKACAIGL